MKNPTIPAKLLLLLQIVCLFVTVCASAAGDIPSTLDLSGTWRFHFDRNDAGVKEKWFGKKLTETITLPNSTDTAGKGNPNSPDLGQTGRLMRAVEYTGPAWYQRDIEIPAGWDGKQIRLFLERPHWETRLWIDDEEVGMQDSLSVPHEFDLTGKLKPGRHRLTLRVDNSMKYKVGQWAHSVTDEVMGNWNGIIGRIELRATDPVFLEDVRVGSDLEKKILWVDGKVRNTTPGQPSGGVTCTVRKNAGGPVLLQGITKLAMLGADTPFRIEIPLDGKLELWDEFHPNLYLAGVSLDAGDGKMKASEAIPFGVRALTARDGQFLINGRPTFLRGNLTGGEFPLTGHFPMDEKEWERVIRVMKSYGLNHLRFHSFCPPDAGFAAADRLGFYFSPEAPFWAKFQGDSPEGKFLRDEALRMIRRYGNHPSFVMMGLGNEIGGDNPYYSGILRELKEADSRRLYTCDVNEPGPGPNAGKRKSPIDDCDFFVTRHTEKGGLRLGSSDRFSGPVAADGTDCDYVEAASAIEVPLVAHELGQWAVHPTGAEIPKYTGVMKPYNLMFFKNLLDARGMGDQADMIGKASGRLAWQLYKEDMELCLRTPKFGGFQLLQLQDFPGQGDALVGLLDAHWESKGILTPEEFRGACSETVPLARFRNFVWTSNQTFESKIDVANHGPADLKNAIVNWSLSSADGKFKKTGTLAPADLKQGTVTHAGDIAVPLAALAKAEQLKLVVGIEGTSYRNEWPLWVYPPDVPTAAPADILVADRYDDAVKKRLAEGGTVLLSLPATADTDSMPAILRTRFKPVFWSYLWRSTRHEGTMGLLCDPENPALKEFPTDFFSSWQWAELANNARAFVLNDTPPDDRPIVQGIDDFHRGWKLGHVIEGRVGPGRILISGFDLHTGLDKRIVARQLRRSLLDYMAGPDFKPARELDPGRIFAVSPAFTGQVSTPDAAAEPAPSAPGKKPAKSALDVVQAELDQFDKMASTKKAATGPSAAFDLNWNSKWNLAGSKLPQELTLDFGRQVKLGGLLYVPPKADGIRVSKFEVFFSDDPQNPGEPVARFSAREHSAREVTSKWFFTILFDKPRTGRFLRIVIPDDPANKNPLLSVGEFEPVFHW